MIEYEIFCDIVIFTQLSPFNFNPLIESLKTTGKLLTVEEGTLTLGWGAEIIARVIQTTNIKAVKRIAAKDLPIANAKTLEEQILPTTNDVVQAVIDLYRY
jgi:pyruvate/2-oxoglutarate/acetoin dehydrogenase E1 component